MPGGREPGTGVDQPRDDRLPGTATVALSAWELAVRRAVIDLRTEGLFSYQRLLSNVFMFYMLIINDYPAGHILNWSVVLVSVTLIALLLRREAVLTVRRIDELDLAGRFLARDPVFNLLPRQADTAQPQELLYRAEAAAEIKDVTSRFYGLLNPGKPDPYQTKFIWFVISIIALVVVFYCFSTLKRPNLGEAVTWAVGCTWFLTVTNYFGSRGFIWTRTFCSRLSLRLGSDLVSTTNELALGMAVLAESLDMKVRYLNFLGGGTLILLLLGGSIALGACSIYFPGLNLEVVILLICMLVPIINGLILARAELDDALGRSSIALQLFGGDIVSAQFSTASRFKVGLLFPLGNPESIVRRALLVALEPADHVPFPPLRHNWWIPTIGGGLIALIALVHHRAHPEIDLVITLVIPFAIATAGYLWLNHLCQVGGRVVAVLEYLRDEAMAGR